MSENDLKNAVKEFQRTVEITRDVRFSANLRLIARSRNSGYLTSALSLFVIAISLLPNIVPLQEKGEAVLLSVSIILSVFIIFSSLIDGSQNFYHRAELLHQCARKIASIHLDLKTIGVLSDEKTILERLKELEAKYRVILDECPVNHDSVDFWAHMARKPHLFERDRGKCPIWLFQLIKRSQSVIFGNVWMIAPVIAMVAAAIVIFIFAIEKV